VLLCVFVYDSFPFMIILSVYLSTSKGTSDIAGVSQGQAPGTSVVQTSTNICKVPEG
jgi:hypothetical protein